MPDYDTLYNLIEKSPFAITIWKVDEFGKEEKSELIYANKQCDIEIGIDLKDYTSQNIQEVFPNSIDTEFSRSLIKSATKDKSIKIYEYEYQDDNIPKTLFELSITPIDGYFVSVYHRNITVKNKFEKKLKKMVSEDPLTKCNNLRGFKYKLRDALKKAEVSGEMIAVLFIDLDKFKIVNDEFGHDSGNIILRDVISNIKNILRKNDIIGRLGGDEFGIILSGIKRESDVEATAKKIISEISKQKWSFKGKEVGIGLSIGIYLACSETEDVDDIIKNADSAMYKSKVSGGNKYIIYD